MTEQKPQNIINMTVFKSTVNSQNRASSETLKKCRDLVMDRLSNALSGMLDKADDLFFDLVQKSGPSEHSFYFNAMREVRLKRSSIESGFKDTFTNIFESTLSNHTADNTGQVEDIDLDIEESLALSSSVERIRHQCHGSLLELDQHMRELLEQPDIVAASNPVSPETICRCFQSACDPVESGIEVKLILFKLFEKYVAMNLDAVYSDMNSFLTENSISARARQNSSNAGDNTAQGLDESRGKNRSIIKDKNYFVIANRIIKNEINQHFGQADLPAFVRNFIYCYWSKLLLKIYIKEGVDSKAWLHAMEVIDDLVNCVGDRSSMNEKLMLSNVMPNLVQRLKFGMNVIPVKNSQGDEFISELLQYHSDLLDRARAEIEKEDKQTGPEQASEDITVPSFRTTVNRTPFMDELLVDNKNKWKNDFDMD